VISQKSYLNLLKAQIDRYLQNPGRFIQSVSESSFDAWIKFYRQDENSNNAGTSYYNKGSLVALCLDFRLAFTWFKLRCLDAPFV
jgi:predicted metalloprotease with PDZ domain